MTQENPITATPLNWSLFDEPQSEVPWETLDQLADAAVTDPALLESMLDQYETMLEQDDLDIVCPAGLVLMPAVIALAGPRLSIAQQTYAAETLLSCLDNACEIQDDLTAEVLTLCGGWLGKGGMNAATDAIMRIHTDRISTVDSGWFHHWGIAKAIIEQFDSLPNKQRLDDFAAAMIEAAIQAEDPDYEPDSAAYYLAISDPQRLRPLIDPLINVAKKRYRGGMAYVVNELLEVRRVIDGEAVDYGLHGEDYFRRSIESRLDWLNRPIEEDETDGDIPFNLDDVAGRHYKPLEPFVHEEPRVGRNDPCPCGSGKKYKKCCQKV